MGERPDYKIQIKEKLKEVDFSDGVSKEEAIIIAQNYLLEKKVKLENMNFIKPKVGESDLIKGCWAVVFAARFKFKMESGLQWFIIDVDKKTGEIKTWGWGPA